MSEPWSTHDEIHFLETQLGILEHLDGRKSPISRLDLLKRYQTASEKRINWSGLDKKKIIQTVKQLIKTEEKKI